MSLPESWSGIVSSTASQLQVTLVDCPGHASLIRTIIGGAQIIDMVVLVIDATKGIQTQTAECLVIAEMTTPHLLVVLNKVDSASTTNNVNTTKHETYNIEGLLRLLQSQSSYLRNLFFDGRDMVN